MDRCIESYRFQSRLVAVFLALTLGLVASNVKAASAPVTPIPRDGETVLLRNWLLAGMFPSPELAEKEQGGPLRSGYDTDYLTEFGGEGAARLVDGTQVHLPDGSTVTFELREWRSDYINLAPIYGMQSEVLAYLYSEIENPVEQDVYVHIGSNDAGKFWVNGELLIEHPFDRTANKSQNAAMIHLPAGRIPLLAKIDQAGGNWGMFVEIYGKTEHERILEAAGPDAYKTASDLIAELRTEFGDPQKLSGAVRDAFTAALLSFERVARVATPSDEGETQWRPELFGVPMDIQTLRNAVASARAGESPYANRAGTYEAAYLSEADGTAQPFMVSVPDDFDPAKQYNLLIDMHGASGTHEQADDWWHSYSQWDSAYFDNTIAIAVMGRGRWSGYEGLGEDDVLQAMEWTMDHYPINPDRVFISGGSMGGGGSWRIASRYPDRFAAAWPECGWPEWNVVANTLNLPVYLNHGNADWMVAKTYTAMGAAYMSEMGNPVFYTEWDGVGHGVGAQAREGGWVSRLAAHTRVTDPLHVRVHADHPRSASINWVTVARWINPHAVAKVEAQIVGTNTITVGMENVKKATLTPPESRLASDGDLVWLVNGHRIVAPRSADGAYDLVRGDVPAAAVGGDSSWTVQTHVEEPVPTRRPYVAGSTNNLYRGEPLLIVYGTKSRRLNDAMRGMADEVSRWLKPNDSPMEFGRVPIKADRDVTEADLETKNLFLIGGPKANSITKRLSGDLPIQEVRGKLRVEGGERISLKDRGYCMVYPNPEHPMRLMAIYASEVEQFYSVRKSKLTDWYVTEFDPFVPDVLVEEVAQVDSAEDARPNKIVRSFRYTHGWELTESSSLKPTNHPANSGEYAQLLAKSWLKATEADYAFSELWQGTEVPINYVPGVTTWSDLAINDEKVMTFDVTGAELLRFASHEETELPWIYPAVDVNAINEDATYRIVGPEWICWPMSGSFHWNPMNPEFFEEADVLERCYREEWGVR
jgi:poly(3-hydroxybutyrate) depolymerase